MICPTLFYAVFCGSAARQHCERILLAAIETNSGIALQKARDAPRSVYCLHAFLLHRQRTLEVVRVRSSLQGPVVAKPVLDSTPLPMFIYSHPSIFMRSAVWHEPLGESAIVVTAWFLALSCAQASM